MKIDPLFQLMNHRTNFLNSSSKTNAVNVNFSKLLKGNQETEKGPKMDVVETSPEQASFQLLVEDLKQLIEDLSLSSVNINESINQESEQINITDYPLSALIGGEITNRLEQTHTMDELLDQVKNSPTIVGVLTLVHVIEDFPKENEKEFSPFLTKLNDLLEQEFPSYKNDESIQFSSMIKAINEMGSSDRSILEGEIMVHKWSSDNEEKLFNSEKLLFISNRLNDTTLIPLHEAQVKSDIINDLLSDSLNQPLESNIKTILGSSDLSTIKTIFNKVIGKIFQEVNNSMIQIDSSENREQYQYAPLKISDFSGRNDLDVKFKELNLVKSTDPIIDSKQLKSDLTDPLVTVDSIINSISNQIKQLSQKAGIDLSPIEKEITSILNQYTHDVTNSTVYMKNKLGNVDKNVNKFNDLSGKIQDLNLPMIKNIVEIEKLVEQVANKLAIEVSDVLDEVDNQNHQIMFRLDNGKNYVMNGLKQFAPFISKVNEIMNSIELLSTKQPIDELMILSKIESSLQSKMIEFNSINQKVSQIEISDPMLFEKILPNLLKPLVRIQDRQINVTSTDLEDNVISTDEQLDSLLAKVNKIIPSSQKIIDTTFAKSRPVESIKNVEIREESFIFEIDKSGVKRTIGPDENQKRETTVKQEFTNQLLNAFKTSKFAQLPNGANRLVIKLNPEHLGSLTVKLVQKDGEMIAKIIASTESAKDLLDHSVRQLKQALPSVQVEIERFEVNTDQQPKTFRENPEQKERHKQETLEPRTEDDQEPDQSFGDSLLEALNTTV